MLSRQNYPAEQMVRDLRYLDSFLEFESKSKLFEVKIRNIHIWEYVRDIFYYEMLKYFNNYTYAPWEREKKRLAVKQTISSKLVKRINQIPKLLLILFKRVSKGKLNKKDLLVLNFHNRFLDEGHYKCKFSDYYLESSKYSYYVLETSSNHNIFRSIPTKNLLYPQINYQFYRFCFFISNFFKKITYRLTIEEESVLESIIEKYRHWFNLDNVPNFHLIKREIEEIIRIHPVWEKVYNKYVNIIHPKAIVYVSQNAYTRRIITEIAKIKKIPTIELQHGASVHSDDVLYNFQKQFDLTTFPDYIFVYGSLWKNNVKFPIPENRIFPVGFPYLEKKVIKYKNQVKKSKIKNILFLSQMQIFEKLSDCASDLYDLIDSYEFNIIYKLHPAEMAIIQEIKKKFSGKKIEIIGNSQKELYHYFSISSFAVGVSSTTIFEAFAFSIPIFIYKMDEYQTKLIRFMINKNFMSEFSNANDLKRKLSSSEEQKISDRTQIGELLWKTNSIENINDAISKVITNDVSLLPHRF